MSVVQAVCAILFVAHGVAAALCIGRLVRGPSLPDRVVAFDALATVVVGMLVLACVAFDNVVYADAILVLSVLGFIGTVTYAKFLARGEKILD